MNFGARPRPTPQGGKPGPPLAGAAPPAPAARDAAPGLQAVPNAVAVVPFVNVSAEPSDDWIGTGMAETLLTTFKMLAAVSLVDDVRLLGGGGAPSRPGETSRGLLEASRRRGAAWLVTGGYRRFGDRVEITARLVHTGTGEVAARVQVDGTLGELFALQDRIGQQLARAVASLGSL